jgi:hypothetical protein
MKAKKQTMIGLLNEEINSLAGQVFTDGPYEYRIYVKTGELGDDSIVSLSIFIENTPAHVGVDLYLMALEKVAQVAGDHIQNSDWMINKVILESYEGLGEMTSMIMGQRSNTFGLQSFQSLLQKIKTNLNKKIDFEEVNSTIEVRKRKLTKVLEYIQRNLTKVGNSPLSLRSYTITGEAKRHNEDTLAPSIKINIMVALNRKDHPESRETLDHIRDKIESMIEELSSIDLHSYDSVSINWDIKK